MHPYSGYSLNYKKCLLNKGTPDAYVLFKLADYYLS
jgi:hypothetical protein